MVEDAANKFYGLACFDQIRIIQYKHLKMTRENKSVETLMPLFLNLSNTLKNRLTLKDERNWRTPSLVSLLLQRTLSNSLKLAIFDDISSGFVYDSLICL